MAEPEQQIHVLLLPYPTQGHINPILQFGKRLAAHRGVRCTLAATRFTLSQSRQQPQPGVDAIRVATISDGCDRGGYAEAGGIRAYLERLESAGSETVDELLRSERAQGRPVHALVYDAFVPWAQRVARRHGAACAAFFTQSCAVDVAYAHAWTERLKVPLLAGEEPGEMPGLPAGLTRLDLPSFLVKPEDYLGLVLNQFKGLDTADQVLVNSFYELEPQESEFMASMWRARTVGPTVPSAYLDNRLPEDTSYGFHLYTPLTATTKAWLCWSSPEKRCLPQRRRELLLAHTHTHANWERTEHQNTILFLCCHLLLFSVTLLHIKGNVYKRPETMTSELRGMPLLNACHPKHLGHAARRAHPTNNA